MNYQKTKAETKAVANQSPKFSLCHNPDMKKAQKIQPVKRIQLPAQVVLSRFNNNIALASRLTGISRTLFYPAIERGYFGDVHARRILEFSPDLETFAEVQE